MWSEVKWTRQRQRQASVHWGSQRRGPPASSPRRWHQRSRAASAGRALPWGTHWRRTYRCAQVNGCGTCESATGHERSGHWCRARESGESWESVGEWGQRVRNESLQRTWPLYRRAPREGAAILYSPEHTRPFSRSRLTNIVNCSIYTRILQFTISICKNVKCDLFLSLFGSLMVRLIIIKINHCSTAMIRLPGYRFETAGVEPREGQLALWYAYSRAATIYM